MTSVDQDPENGSGWRSADDALPFHCHGVRGKGAQRQWQARLLKCPPCRRLAYASIAWGQVVRRYTVSGFDYRPSGFRIACMTEVVVRRGILHIRCSLNRRHTELGTIA